MDRINVIRFSYHEQFFGYCELDGIFCIFYVTDFVTYLLPDTDKHFAMYFYNKFHAYITHDPNAIRAFADAQGIDEEVTLWALEHLGNRSQIESHVLSEDEVYRVSQNIFSQILHMVTEETTWN